MKLRDIILIYAHQRRENANERRRRLLRNALTPRRSNTKHESQTATRKP